MNLQEQIRKVLKEEKADKMIMLVGKYLNAMYPRFNKKETETYEDVDRRGYPTVSYYDTENGIYLLTYHYGDKELQLSTSLFNELEGLFGDEMEYFIDWFNNEFGLDAEYVTY